MAQGTTPTQKEANRRGLRSLTPLMFFLLAYLGGSAVLGDFYKIPMTVAFLASSILAVAVSRGGLNKRIARFSAGAGDKNILLMVWIYVLAGRLPILRRPWGRLTPQSVSLCASCRPP